MDVALCGVAPLLASSGRTTGSHRLNRRGDRAANNAHRMIVLTRKRYCLRTHAYVARHTTAGLNNRTVTRCRKRHVARKIYSIINSQDARKIVQQPIKQPLDIHRSVPAEPRALTSSRRADQRSPRRGSVPTSTARAAGHSPSSTPARAGRSRSVS